MDDAGWIAAATSRIRVASRVLGVPYRPPAMVAKMAETLDRLSGGRLILGLGGGSGDEEMRAFGLGPPSPRDKVDGLAEALAIAAARATGRDPSEIACVYNMEIRVDRRADSTSDAVGGSPDQVAERLLGFVRLGFTGFNFILADPKDDYQPQLLASEVIPTVREGA